MSPLSRGASALEQRLAEIDQRLRAVQRDLRPDLPAASVRPPASLPPFSPLTPTPPAIDARVPTTPPEPDAQAPEEGHRAPEGQGGEAAHRAQAAGARRGPLANLLDRDQRRRNTAHGDIAAELTRLVEVNDQLLEVVRRLLSISESEPRWFPAVGSVPPPPDPVPPASVAVAANPFSEIAALRDFAAQLGRLESVQDVTLRGYEGELGAVLEVRLGRSSA